MGTGTIPTDITPTLPIIVGDITVTIRAGAIIISQLVTVRCGCTCIGPERSGGAKRGGQPRVSLVLSRFGYASADNSSTFRSRIRIPKKYRRGH
jgi:hypothetical protein